MIVIMSAPAAAASATSSGLRMLPAMIFVGELLWAIMRLLSWMTLTGSPPASRTRQKKMLAYVAPVNAARVTWLVVMRQVMLVFIFSL